MKRCLLALSVLLALSITPVFADIGENYAKGGIGLVGSVSYFNNFFYFQDPNEKRNDWYIDVSPSVHYFVADRLALMFSPFFHYEAYTVDPNNIARSESYGASLGLSYALLMDPTASTGFVLAIGGSIGLAEYPTINSLVAGVETPNGYALTDFVLTFSPRLYYFLNDRLAPFIGITPQFFYVVAYNDPTGAAVSLTSQQRLQAELTVTLGIAFFIPNKKATMFLGE